MSTNRFLAIHGKTGVQVEVLSLANPHWPEVRFQAAPDVIEGLCEIFYPDGDPDEEVQAEVLSSETAILTVDFITEPYPLTPGSVLVEVLNWLDEL